MECVVAILSALSDPIRLRSLALMAGEGELCVCELTYTLEAGQPTISKHLATLREAGLVKDRRRAQWVFYSVATDLRPWAGRVVDAALDGVAQAAEHAADLRRLKAMPGRPPRDGLA